MSNAFSPVVSTVVRGVVVSTVVRGVEILRKKRLA
jgi:hypothetical protein